MKQITKDNISEFMEYYHELHDSIITNINYSVLKDQIELLIDVHWSGEPILKDDGYYETNKKKIRMIFNEIESCNNKEISSCDFISQAFLKYITLDNKEFICFASEEEDPSIYIVCESIEYEEVL